MRGTIAGVLLSVLLLMAAVWAQEASTPVPPAPEPAAPAEPEKATEGEGGDEEETEIVEVAVRDLKKGDHAMLLLRNGQSFEGHVFSVGQLSVTIDFTLSRQDVAGKVTFPVAVVLVAKRLPPLSAEERAKRLELRRQRVRQARDRWAKAVPGALLAAPEEEELTPEQMDEIRREEERRQVEEYSILLREFPPEQGWGPERLAQIRYRHFIIGLPVSYPEWRFWQVFDQWSEANTIVELYERQQEQEQRALLTMFPPTEGWGPAVKKQLEEKQASGEQLSQLEARFLKDYSRWQEAVEAGKGQEAPPAAPPAAPVPAPTSPAAPGAPETP